MAESKVMVGACIAWAMFGWSAPARALECSTQYFVYASERLTLGDRSTIGYGSIGAGIAAELGASARSQGSLVADSISLRSNALLNGAAYTNHPVGLQQGARIFGRTLPISSGLVCSAPVIPTIEPGGEDVYVEGTMSLAPGHYGHIYVTPDSTLFVSGGDYHFEIAVFEPDSKLVGIWQGAPARLLVSDGVMFGDRHQQSISKRGSNTSTRAAIAVYSLQAHQLRLGTDSVIYSQVIAPFAEVSVPSRTAVRAPIYGRNVVVEPDSSIGSPVAGQPNACQ